MTDHPKRAARVVLFVVLAVVLAACGLPRSGPNKAEIFAGGAKRNGDAFIIEVDDEVAQLTAVVPAYGFGPVFLNAGIMGSDVIAPGDILGLTV